MQTATRNGNGRSGARELITGEIESKNEWGIKVGGSWWNYSQYPGAQEGDFPAHDAGDQVELTVTGGKWLAGLQHVDPFQDEAPRRPTPQPVQAELIPVVAKMLTTNRKPSTAAKQHDLVEAYDNERRIQEAERRLQIEAAEELRQLRIVRQSSLKSAAAIAASMLNGPLYEHFDDPVSWVIGCAERLVQYVQEGAA